MIRQYQDQLTCTVMMTFLLFAGTNSPILDVVADCVLFKPRAGNILGNLELTCTNAAFSVDNVQFVEIV